MGSDKLRDINDRPTQTLSQATQRIIAQKREAHFIFSAKSSLNSENENQHIYNLQLVHGEQYLDILVLIQFGQCCYRYTLVSIHHPVNKILSKLIFLNTRST